MTPSHILEFEFENTHFTEMCSGSEAGSYLRIIDSVHHSTLCMGVTKKKKKFEVDAPSS